MSSGVTLADGCQEAFEKLKLGSKLERCVIYKISDDKRSIEVERVIKKHEKGDDQREEYEAILKELPEEEGRYIVWDLDVSEEGKQTSPKVILVNWSPDSATVKNKMLFASSKNALKKALTGIHKQVDCNDSSEISYDAVMKEAKNKI